MNVEQRNKTSPKRNTITGEGRKKYFKQFQLYGWWMLECACQSFFLAWFNSIWMKEVMCIFYCYDRLPSTGQCWKVHVYTFSLLWFKAEAVTQPQANYIKKIHFVLLWVKAEVKMHQESNKRLNQSSILVYHFITIRFPWCGGVRHIWLEETRLVQLVKSS